MAVVMGVPAGLAVLLAGAALVATLETAAMALHLAQVGLAQVAVAAAALMLVLEAEVAAGYQFMAKGQVAQVELAAAAAAAGLLVMVADPVL
jgi:hypothetical protein